MIKIITGDSAVFNFAIVYPGAVDGVPAPDLSNSTVVFAMKKRNGKSVAFEESVSGPETNVVTFSMTPQESSKLIAGVYDACCKVYSGDAATTVWMGDITVIEGVLID